MSTASPEALDAAKLERLFVRLEKPLYNVVYRWVFDAQEASEIVQDSFVAIWRRRDTVQLETVEALLYRTAINRAKNRRRWLRLRKFVGLGSADALQFGHGPEGQVLDAQQRQRVRRAIDALPEAQRAVITLVHFSDLSYRQVAAIVGIPEGTVGSRRNTALRALRHALEDTDGPR